MFIYFTDVLIIGPILWGHSGPPVMRCRGCCRRHRCAGGMWQYQ